MLRYTSIIGLLLAVGCGSKDTADADPAGSDDAGECGDPQAALTSPSNTSDANYRTTVAFTFSTDKDDSATISLSGPDGEISGSSDWSDKTLTFTPSEDLAFDTTYEATLTHCGGSDSESFSTSNVGSGLDGGEASLVDKTYSVDLAAANFVKPPDVGTLLGSLLTQNILIGIDDANESSITMKGALAEPGNDDQDMCTATFGIPTADFSTAPYFSVSADAITIAVSGFNININDFTLEGDFTPDGSQISGAVLAGQLDARDLAPAIVETGLITAEDPDEVCGLLSGFGVECEPCTDGKDYCVTVEVNDINAEETGNTLEDVTQAAVDADPACAE